MACFYIICDIVSHRLEVTLEKQVEGVAWEYLTKEDAGSKVNTRDQDTDELTAEEMEDLKKRLTELTVRD